MGLVLLLLIFVVIVGGIVFVVYVWCDLGVSLFLECLGLVYVGVGF